MEKPIRFSQVRDWADHRLGRLVVMRLLGRRNGSTIWSALCDCGVSIEIASGDIKKGKIKSCGCYRKDRTTRHGYSGTRIYYSWGGMIQRCSNPNNRNYGQYGAKGIKVCPRWLKFENFLADMGERPAGTTLDRRDGNKDYTPNNCRWSTIEQQARNKKNNIFVNVNNAVMCIADASRLLGISFGAVTYRVQKGHIKIAIRPKGA